MLEHFRQFAQRFLCKLNDCLSHLAVGYELERGPMIRKDGLSARDAAETLSHGQVGTHALR